MDSRRFTGDPAPLHTTSSLTALPERVTELFHSMLDGEHFFRSPFIRHKIVVPNLLFSNGTTGLDPIFTSDSPSSSSTDGSSHSPGGGPTPMHIPPPAPSTRHTNSKLVFSQSDGAGSEGTARRLDGGVVRNIPIRLMATATTAQDNKPSGANSNNVSSSTTIDFSSKPISSSLLKNVLQNRHPSESEESDSPSLRSAPPELLHQRNNKEVEEEGENSISSNIRNNRVSFNDNEDSGDLMARRKLSTPKDLFSHSSMLSLRGQPQQQQQQYTTTGQQYQQQQQNPSLAKSHSPRQLSDELSAPSIQRRHFSWQQPQRNQHNDSRSNSMDQEDESLQKRLQETKNNERNSNSSTPVNFRSVPIVQLNSSQNQKENSFGNAVQLDYNSNNNNNNASWQQSQQRSSTPAAGDTSLENSKAYYSAIPFRRPPSTTRELSDGIHSTATMTSAISSPSLLTGKPAISFIKRQQTPSKRAFYQSNEAERLEQQQTTPPSFLRRTQTVYTIPSGNLPRRDSEPSVIIDASNNNNHLTAESAHSGAHSNRRSLHETSLQQQQPSDAHSAHPPSRSKSPSMASLRQSLKSFSTKPKKITFVPSCVRGNQQASSDEEDHQARNRMEEEASARLARSRSPSITASSLRLTEFVPNEEDLVRNATFTPKHKKEDSVEEAIRSLESFDPNDYYVRTNHKNERDHTGAPHYPINTNSSSYYIRQPNITSSDDESLPPPPPLPILTSTRYLSQQQPTIQERHWNTTTPTRFTDHKGNSEEQNDFKTSHGQRDSAASTLTSSSTTSSPDSTTSTSSTHSKQDTPTQQPVQASNWQTDNNHRSHYRQPQPPQSKTNNCNSLAGVTFRRPSATSLATSSGSATPTGPQSTADLSFNRSFENRTPRATTPTSIISPTAMGNSNGVVYIGPPAVHNHQRNSTSTPNTNHYQPPSNVPFEMDQLLNRLKNDRKNAQTPINVQTVMAPPHCSPDYEDNDEDDIEAAAEAEAHLRKRFLCTQLTDCAKVVEINAHKMSQFAAAGGGGWRQAHILRHNLAAIRDTVYTIEFALEELVDALARISLERNDSKATEFHQLSAPLFTSQSLIRRLRANLDGTGWSLQALARQTAAPLGTNDALDQFVAVLRQLPRDCYRLVQWIYLLGVWNNGGTGPAVFLSTSTHPHSHSVPPPPAPQPYTSPPINAQRYSTSSSSTSNESPRNSGVPPPQPTKTSSSQTSRPANTPKVNFQQQKPVSPAKPVDIVPLQAPTMAEINMDGGESTTSSNTSSLNMEDTVTDQQLGSKNMNKLNSPIKKNVSISHEEPEEASKVYEEDDLMSVASESIDSLYGDYTLVGADQTSSRPGSAASGNVAMVRPQPKNLVSGHNGVGSPRETRRRGMTQTQLELAKGLEEEDRELMRFYQPQVEANTQELCRLVDEFFTIVEEHQAAKSFVQKIQMICIKTQTLVCIARMVTKDDITAVSKKLHDFLAKEANSLDGLLNECVGSARIAKDKSQSVAAVQQMVTSVMAVSQAALNLKSFWKSCV